LRFLSYRAYSSLLILTTADHDSEAYTLQGAIVVARYSFAAANESEIGVSYRLTLCVKSSLHPSRLGCSLQFEEGEELELVRDSDMSGNGDWWLLRNRHGHEGAFRALTHFFPLHISLAPPLPDLLLLFDCAFMAPLFMAGFAPSSYFDSSIVDDDDEDDFEPETTPFPSQPPTPPPPPRHPQGP
jgi:hypothetical protein